MHGMNRAGVIGALLVVALPLGAATLWDETVDGQLSTGSGAPTPLVLVSTSDVILGSASTGYRYATFTVPPGETVESLVIDSGSGLAQLDLHFGLNADSPAVCGGFATPGAPVEVLDGTTCMGSLVEGDYTIGVNPLVPVAWTVTIGSTVPVELQSFSVE